MADIPNGQNFPHVLQFVKMNQELVLELELVMIRHLPMVD